MIDGFESLDGVDGVSLVSALEAGPMVRVLCRNGSPRAASLLQLVEAPAEAVWRQFGDVDEFPRVVKMVEKVTRLPRAADGQELVEVDLRFKISLFAAKFGFVAELHQAEGRLLDLRYHSGKVRDVVIELEVAPVSEERSVLRCHVGFDQTSLGWLVRVFIRHHPEIDWGVHAGSVLSVASSVCKAAEEHWVQARGNRKE